MIVVSSIEQIRQLSRETDRILSMMWRESGKVRQDQSTV